MVNLITSEKSKENPKTEIITFINYLVVTFVILFSSVLISLVLKKFFGPQKFKKEPIKEFKEYQAISKFLMSPSSTLSLIFCIGVYSVVIYVFYLIFKELSGSDSINKTNHLLLKGTKHLNHKVQGMELDLGQVKKEQLTQTTILKTIEKQDHQVIHLMKKDQIVAKKRYQNIKRKLADLLDVLAKQDTELAKTTQELELVKEQEETISNTLKQITDKGKKILQESLRNQTKDVKEYIKGLIGYDNETITFLKSNSEFVVNLEKNNGLRDLGYLETLRQNLQDLDKNLEAGKISNALSIIKTMEPSLEGQITNVKNDIETVKSYKNKIKHPKPLEDYPLYKDQKKSSEKEGSENPKNTPPSPQSSKKR